MDLIKRLNTSKAEVLDLVKKEGINNQSAYCMFAIDTSGSMSGLFNGGWVQKVTERLLPIAMAFDDDGAMEVFEFSNSTKRVSTDATTSNIDGYVKNYLRPEYGGTNYAPALRAILDDYKSKTGQKGGIAGFFSGKAKEILPAYVILITDGQCGDTNESEKVVREMSKYGIYVQTVGISEHREVTPGTFPFLEKLDSLSGRDRDNAGYFGISTTKLETMTDSEFYSLMLKEFPSFVKEAKTAGIIS